jgi:hypothetical protein
MQSTLTRGQTTPYACLPPAHLATCSPASRQAEGTFGRTSVRTACHEQLHANKHQAHLTPQPHMQPMTQTPFHRANPNRTTRGRTNPTPILQHNAHQHMLSGAHTIAILTPCTFQHTHPCHTTHTAHSIELQLAGSHHSTPRRGHTHTTAATRGGGGRAGGAPTRGGHRHLSGMHSARLACMARGCHMRHVVRARPDAHVGHPAAAPQPLGTTPAARAIMEHHLMPQR